MYVKSLMLRPERAIAVAITQRVRLALMNQTKERSPMNRQLKTGLVLCLGLAMAGCGGQKIKPGDVLCPIVGAAAGAGVVAAGADTDETGALAGGAVVGAAIAYLVCHEADKPAPAAPAPAPAPAPARATTLPSARASTARSHRSRPRRGGQTGPHSASRSASAKAQLKYSADGSAQRFHRTHAAPARAPAACPAPHPPAASPAGDGSAKAVRSAPPAWRAATAPRPRPAIKQTNEPGRPSDQNRQSR